MRAVQVDQPIGPGGLRVAEVAEPEGEVVIEVRAAGVSFPDLLLSRGEYQLSPDPPFTLGLEAAGVVRKANPDSGFSPGERVAAFVPGAFAEFAAAAAHATFRLPGELTFAEGAGLVVNSQTAHFALARRARLQAEETLLVHGAGGGVGTAAVGVGGALGARVIAVVSSKEKEHAAREAGADEVVGVDEEWPQADVVFDPVGGERLEQSLRCLRPEGRVVVVGFAAGAIPSVKANRLLYRNVSVVGAGWGHFALERPDYMREVGRAIEQMITAGRVRPIVGRSYPLDEAARALTDLEARRAVGKLVLEVAGSSGEGQAPTG